VVLVHRSKQRPSSIYGKWVIVRHAGIEYLDSITNQTKICSRWISRTDWLNWRK